MNKDYKRRDEIIFGNYRASRYESGGCARADISIVQLKQLIEEDFINVHENQNDSPNVLEFLNDIEGHEDNAIFEIYAISPDREDYRVTIEGINIDISDSDKDALCYFIEQWRYADEFTINNMANGYSIRAWWD